jgi:predicted metal-dependent hydrolase
VGWDMRPQTLTPDEEKELLEKRKGWLERQLAEITQRIQDSDKE